MTGATPSTWLGRRAPVCAVLAASCSAQDPSAALPAGVDALATSPIPEDQHVPDLPSMLVTYGEFNVHPAKLAPKGRHVLAKSVAVVVADEKQFGSGVFRPTPLTELNGMPLCNGTPYRGEDSLYGQAATATVIGVDVLLTARHFVCATGSTLDQCKQVHAAKKRKNRVVFGWNDPSQLTWTDEDVYTLTGVCSIGQGGVEGGKTDWAIIQVRPGIVECGADCKKDPIAAAHPPIPVTQRAPSSGEEIFVFAYPFGTPAKYADCGTVTKLHDNVVTTTLDAVSGFSGAPIFSESASPELLAMHTASTSLLTTDPEPCRWRPRDVTTCCDLVMATGPQGGVVPGVCGEGDEPEIISQSGCMTIPICADSDCCAEHFNSVGLALFPNPSLSEAIVKYAEGKHDCAE